MNVIDERTDVKIKFEDIDYGDAFKWKGETCMRIQTIYGHDGDGDIITNAVDVDNGEARKFEDDDLVEPLDAELIIKG